MSETYSMTDAFYLYCLTRLTETCYLPFSNGALYLNRDSGVKLNNSVNKLRVLLSGMRHNPIVDLAPQSIFVVKN